MNRKEELVKLKDFFKSKGLKYEDLEEKLNYGKGTLRSGIARGGTDKMLLGLQKLKIKLFPEEAAADNLIKEPISTYGHKSFNAEYIELQGKLIESQAELLRTKDEISSLRKENEQLKAELLRYRPVNVEQTTYSLPGEKETRAAAS